MLTRLSIALWSLFADDLKLEEAEQQHFRSLQACFTRKLRPGARPIDMNPAVAVSPCDAIVGACGEIEDGRVYQTKGFPYEMSDLIPDAQIRQRYRRGVFVTLRLKSSMYHRFHAPLSGQVNQLLYVAGDTWNVNPVALKRVEKLFCKNERAVLELDTGLPQGPLCLVPVAAVLVASMRFNCLEENLSMRYDGPARISCAAEYSRGDEMGYFQHGSTILVFAPPGYALHADVRSGEAIKIGQPLLQLTQQPTH